MYLCMKLDLIEICLKDMWWVIPYASPDRRHLRDVPSPATGTQGYQIQASLPVGTSNCIAHLPPVKAKPLRGGWVCVLVRRSRLRKSRDINYEKAEWISFSMAFDQGPGCCQKQRNWTRVMRRPSFRKFLLNRWSDFCILSEKTPSNFRISKNRWKEKWGYLYKLQPKRDYFCTDVGHRQKCVNRPHPTRNTHSKDGDK